MPFDNLVRIVSSILAVVIAITIHEFAHAYSAYRYGDRTPNFQGRISLNPLDHFDPVGFTMICVTSIFGFGFGWGKPVMVNPGNFNNPRVDDVKVAAWGPASNIIQAAFVAGVLRLAPVVWPEWLLSFLIIFVFVNIGLALFNMIPLPPLDGSHIVSGLLPYQHARAYASFAGQYGIVALLVIIMVPISGGRTIIDFILGPPRTLLASLLLG